jgi:hypothetical protein
MQDVQAPDPLEALDWLQQTPPPLGVDIHKSLYSVADAVRYVRGLYALGACLVTVPQWAIRRREPLGGRPGGVWACGLEVTLPASGPEREALIWFCATELRPTFLFPDQAVANLRTLVQSRMVIVGLAT